MGIDLKYGIEISQTIQSYGLEVQEETYENMLFWNNIFYYYSSYLRKIEQLIVDDVQLYIQSSEVMNLIILIMGMFTLTLATLFMIFYIRPKLVSSYL